MLNSKVIRNNISSFKICIWDPILLPLKSEIFTGKETAVENGLRGSPEDIRSKLSQIRGKGKIPYLAYVAPQKHIQLISGCGKRYVPLMYYFFLAAVQSSLEVKITNQPLIERRAIWSARKEICFFFTFL